MIKIKKCKTCTKKFTYIYNNSQYCKKCTSKYGKNKKYNCKKCNKEVSSNCHRYGTGHCRKCNGKEHSKKLKGRFLGKNNPSYKHGMTGKTKCNKCNKTIAFITWKKGSQLCRNCHSKTISGYNSHCWKGGLPKCKICNKQLASYNAKYCIICANKIKNPIIHKGKNHPSWKGGLPKCKDCKKILKSYYSKRCKKCYYKSISGHNSHNWKGGISKNRNDYERNRKKYDIKYKIVSTLRNRILYAIKNKNKSLSTIFLIGCEIDYLMYYLQCKFKTGMNWDNHGRDGWHIDHIKPCASFDLSKPEEQKKCFHYTNLQPLWAKDNISKHTKW